MHLEAGTVRYSDHAFEGERGRLITEPEASCVLRHGWHEKRKDRHEEQYRHPWTYSIRSKTVDDRRLRVAVTFEMDDGEVLLAVALVDLDLEDDEKAGGEDG